MNRLPPKNQDLRRYVLRRDAWRLCKFLLWNAFLIGGALSYNANHTTYPPERLILGWKLALWIAFVLVSGALIFRIWKLFSPTVQGTVIKSGLSHTYTALRDEPKRPGTDTDADFRTRTALLLMLESGKKKPLRFEQKDGFYLYYREGARLCRFHGLPYPINLDPDGKDGYVCAACGRRSEHFADRCDICSFSMIDPKDL